MVIPAWIFFSLWSLIGAYFFFMGMMALHNADPPISVSPVLLFFINQSSALAAFHSSTYALVFRIKLNIHVATYYILLSFAVFPIALAAFSGDSFSWYFPIYSLFNIFVLLYYFLPWLNTISRGLYFHKYSVGLALFPLIYFLSCGESFLWYCPLFVSNIMIISQYHFAAVEFEQYGLFAHYFTLLFIFMGGCITKEYSPLLLLFFGFFTSVAQAAISGDDRFQRWLPSAAARENPMLSRMKEIVEKHGRVIEFSIGMAGTILFQNLVRLTSFDHVVAFLYLAVAWLANLALLLCPHDGGIFNFLLSNVIVGCTVSEFGLGGTTWLAYAAALLLYILRLQLESLSLVNRGEDEAAVIAWREQDPASIFRRRFI